MKEFTDELMTLLENGCNKNDVIDLLKENIDESVDENDYNEYLITFGIKTREKYAKLQYAYRDEKIENIPFCIVDIETTDSDSSKGQIIDIAAIKVLNGNIIGTFNTLVKCDSIPKYIEELTKISTQDTKNATEINKVMFDFKVFLGTAVFIAHNVSFDFKFINETLKKCNLPIMLNPKLCSIVLSKKVIELPRYGLSYLNETLNLLPTASPHRAFNDTLVTFELFKLILNRLPSHIKTMEQFKNYNLQTNSKKEKKSTK